MQFGPKSSEQTPASDPSNARPGHGSGTDAAGGAALPSLSFPKGGGAIRGIGEKFSANPVSGTGSMQFPIYASPGRSKFAPQLSLSYDSGSGNTAFGFGWSLDLPAITRKTDKGLPQYQDGQESDVFILSGAEDLMTQQQFRLADAANQNVLLSIHVDEIGVPLFVPIQESTFANTFCPLTPRASSVWRGQWQDRHTFSPQAGRMPHLQFASQLSDRRTSGSASKIAFRLEMGHRVTSRRRLRAATGPWKSMASRALVYYNRENADR